MAKSDNSNVRTIAAQSVKGQSFTLDCLMPDKKSTGPSTVPNPEQSEPYRIIDGTAVYHASRNLPLFEDIGFDVRKFHLWGYLEHPYIVPCSYEIPGTVKFYIDTRMKGGYLLRAATKVDSDEFPGTSYDLVAWTEQKKGDTIQSAGYRLVHAALMEILHVAEDSWHCGEHLAPDMEGSEKVALLLGAIYKTVHKSPSALKKRLALLPEYIRPLYEEVASIGETESVYR